MSFRGGAELLTQPEEMAHVRVLDFRAGLHLEREHALIARLDNEIDFMTPVVRAAVVYACLYGLRIDAH